MSFVGNCGTFTRGYRAMILDVEFLYHLLYLLICALGLFVHEFFYSLLVSPVSPSSQTPPVTGIAVPGRRRQHPRASAGGVRGRPREQAREGAPLLPSFRGLGVPRRMLLRRRRLSGPPKALCVTGAVPTVPGPSTGAQGTGWPRRPFQ